MAMQLPLGIGLRDDASFDNFIDAGNEQILSVLRYCDGGDNIVYLWGGASVGKTHLLHAWCRQWVEQGKQVAYLPLLQLNDMYPQICEDLDSLDAVCIDDVQAIAGNAPWEEALFHLYNRLRDAGKFLLVAGNASPGNLGLKLADLVSRLNAALVLNVAALDDAHKCKVLQMRSAARGLEMSDEVVQFLLRHYPRDLGVLIAMLDTLDQASLVAQRRLTIPFIKQVLQS